MPRVRKFNKRNFHGNQHKINGVNNIPDNLNSEPTTSKPSSSNQPAHKSASSTKLENPRFSNEISYNDDEVNIIVNLKLISNLIKTSVKCSKCDEEDCINICLDENGRRGLACKIILSCNSCDSKAETMNSTLNRHRVYNVNSRFVYAMRSIGRGAGAAKTFCAVMNLPPPPLKFNLHTTLLLNAATEVCSTSLLNAANEAVEENNNLNEIAAAFDGSWQKRGHTSLNGVVTATSFDTGKVLDFECITKYCNICKNDEVKKISQEHKNTCKANFEGSSGAMEIAGVKAIFHRSEGKLGVRYTQYLGDGDSKGFASVFESKPYGDVNIIKLECIGHVQKRMGSRLRRLKNDGKGKKLSDGKAISGKGRLTDSIIDKLQTYYGLAIRRNLEDVKRMQQNIWATFFHMLSTDENPRHELCPTGEDSWCRYNKCLVTGDKHSHTSSLPAAVMDAIKPVFKDLADINLLKRCLHGRTQNPNESLNNVIWQRLPKTGFVGYETLKLGVTDAVLCFNEGSFAKCHVLKCMGITPGKFMIQGLQMIDNLRILEANKSVLERSKASRVKKRQLKRKKDESNEEEVYSAGAF